MKISDYISTILKNIEKGVNQVDFVIGSNNGIDVNEEAQNKIHFRVIRKKK